MSFVLPAAPTATSALLQGLSSGFEQSFPKSIQQMIESRMKKKQGDALEKQFGIPGFSKIVQAVGPEKSAEFYQMLLANQQVAQNSGENDSGDNFFKDNLSLNLPDKAFDTREDTISQNIQNPQSLQDPNVNGEVLNDTQENPPQNNIQAPSEKQQGPKPIGEIAGIPFYKGELPKKTVKTPPFGQFQKKAEIEDKRHREFRTDIKEYSKNYENLTELKENKHYIQEAKDLLNKGNINPSLGRKLAIMFADGKISHALLGEQAKKLATNADEQKFAALMMRFARPKDIGGSNPSTREVLLALERNPDILNHPDANKYLIDEMERHADIDLKKGQLISTLRKYDADMDSSVFKDLVESKIDQYASNLPKISALDRRGSKTKHEKILDKPAPGSKGFMKWVLH